MKRRLFLFAMVLNICGFLFLVDNAFAVPPVGGVATGVYAYSGSIPTDAYINSFATSFVPAVDGNHGFVIGPSGSSVTLYSSYDPAVYKIYLLASTAADDLSLTFDGGGLTYDGDIPHFINGKADGYNSFPYYYLELTSGNWDDDAPSDFPTSGFRFYTANITYTGTWQPGDYFFLGVDTNGSEGLQYTGPGGDDKFSPKTTSSTGGPVPEPASVSLLGLGLLGLLGLRKRK